jgi:hypothetical protein
VAPSKALLCWGGDQTVTAVARQDFTINKIVFTPTMLAHNFVMQNDVGIVVGVALAEKEDFIEVHTTIGQI